MEVGLVVLAASTLCVGAILAGAAGQKIDAPILLVFLLFGMLAGREGPGGISLDADGGVLVVGSVALAAILFEGGLRTRPDAFRLGARPGATLAGLGTLLTALIVAPAAHVLFGLDWPAALLLGAIVSSTDAAAVFALAATGLRMPPRIVAALEVESGLNDPLAILLVVGLSVGLAGEPLSALAWTTTLLGKAGLGALVGVGTGVLVPKVVRRLALPGGLVAILTAGFAFMAFGLAEVTGGSGFLAVYLAGLTLAFRAPEVGARVGEVMDGIAWLAQTGLFLLLGLLVTPSQLAALALPAAGVALVLILLARPLAALVCLAPFGFRRRETAFVSWVGLRGATPVYLGLLPAALGVPNGQLYLSAAAVVVLLSLVVQGWTAPVVGRALRLSADVGTPLGRGGVAARLGAATASVGVGAFFAVTLAPAPPPVLMTPGDIASLRAALDAPGPVPARFPPGFAGRALEDRRPLFVETLTRVVRASNARIEADRDALSALAAQQARRGRLTLEEEATVARIARRYGLRFAPPGDLLARIDVVPERLAVAQAALATGWGGSARLVGNNAVFGHGTREGYPSLPAAARGLARYYASHEGFAELRAARAEARAQGGAPTPEALVPHLAPFAGDPAYTETLRAILASPSLDTNETGPSGD